MIGSMFPGRVISLFGDIPQPLHPQIFEHLTILLTLSVHSPTPSTIARIEGGKKEGVTAIDGELLELVKAYFLLRLVTCIQEIGRHVYWL